MTSGDPKAVLKNYLQGGRETLLWKLESLPDYDIRRPMVATGTNLLGLVKHCARTELRYFGDTFNRPSAELSASFRGTEPNADKWAAADESREDLVDLYRNAWRHSDATIDALSLDAVGHVPHWPADVNDITLHGALVHVVVDTQRHAGHADILRELIDGSVGLLKGNSNLPGVEEQWWEQHRQHLQRIAESYRGEV